ncbi:uncharacterized protein LOC130676931 [Microplitis mediator]|uniref:uncharacterized protein LOC130676931 n=1 Tax=Microplitis mediator TaxID=375433 RepID=UPI0025555FDC|nr:uncharacterized protein LOC130676931 [Microplitis mediator]
MRTNSCCVVNCKNTGRNSNCKFYTFPTASWKLDKRKKWISAVRRKNPDGSPWKPKPTDCICSDHFVGGRKAEEESSPSYIPTIFPSIYKKPKIDENAAVDRHTRFLNRRITKKKFTPLTVSTSTEATPENIEIAMDNVIDPVIDWNEKADKECQVDFLSNSHEVGKTFICNRYMYINAEKCDAEIQTEIEDVVITKCTMNRKKYSDKGCNTPTKTFVDQCSETVEKIFLGFESIEEDEQLIDLAGVTFNNFKFLLRRTNTSHKWTIGKEDRLLIFLMKIKNGLTFSALGVLFSVHRTTISRIFYSTLQTLATATTNLVFWPRIDVVQATMPKCFYPKYSNTRVIIDCTEFKIEVPSSVDNRVYCYSHYKKNFTAKVLIGITPGGFICLKSKVAGGRKTDSQLTIESGLIDKLEEGDVVLADKGFPEIKATIDQSGKKIMIVMPPFLEKKTAFSTEETEETYHVARVRIHVERIMQRLRLHSILDKITENLFPYVDDILHICCVLVNLQPPIISNKEKPDE